MPNGVLFVHKSSQHTQTGVAGLWTPPMWAVCAIAALLLSIYVA